MQSVDRALSLLELLDERPGGLVEVADRSQLPVSTTSRLLETLMARGAVERSDDGVFRVGSLVQRLGHATTTNAATLEAIGAETIVALAEELGEAACLSIPIGAQTLTIMQFAVQSPVQAQDWTGHRWPITGGGSGAVMMATWPKSRVDRLLGPLSSQERSAVRADMETATRTGVSWSHGSYVQGLSSVAAPILDADGSAVAAVLAYGPTYRFPAKGDLRRTNETVIAAGTTITRNLKD